jgi:hypothetical protein
VDPKESKDRRAHRAPKVKLALKVSKVFKVPKATQALKENKVFKVLKVILEVRGPKAIRVIQEVKDLKEIRVIQEVRDLKETKAIPENLVQTAKMAQTVRPLRRVLTTSLKQIKPKWCPLLFLHYPSIMGRRW